MGKDGAHKESKAVEPELDLESQLDDIASALNFDLDDDDLDEEASLDAASASLDATVVETPDTPAGAGAAADDAHADELDAEELDELDVEELDSMQVIEDFSDLDDEDEDEGEPEESAPGLGTLYLEVDGEFAEVDQERFVIGRVSKMCDLAIIDVNVSRQHCAIEKREDGYYVVDLGSTNGVVLDGKKVNDHKISEGEEFVLSSHRVRATFTAPEPAAAFVDPSPVAPQGVPDVTGRLPAVKVEGELESQPDPSASTVGRLIAPIAAEPLPPLQDSEPEPAAEPEPRQSTVAAQAPDEPGVIDLSGYTFEERVEIRLDQLAQHVAYLQQQNEALLAHVQQLQGIAGLAELIQQRLAARGGKL